MKAQWLQSSSECRIKTCYLNSLCNVFNHYIVHHEIVTIATSHEYSSENDTIEYLFEHGYIELPFIQKFSFI